MTLPLAPIGAAGAGSAKDSLWSKLNDTKKSKEAMGMMGNIQEVGGQKDINALTGDNVKGAKALAEKQIANMGELAKSIVNPQPAKKSSESAQATESATKEGAL